MAKEKISSQEIIDLMASKLSVSKRVAEDFLKILFATIEESISDGNSVKVKNFGTFKLQWNEPRKSVNVNTGEEIVLDGFNKIVFIPDSLLKNVVNEPFIHLESVVLEEVEVKQYFNDSLKIFNEEAIEIKKILSEINSISKDTGVEENINLSDDKLNENEDKTTEINQSDDLETSENIENIIVDNSDAEPEKEDENIEQHIEYIETKKNDERLSTTANEENKIKQQAIKQENLFTEIIKGKVEPEDNIVEIIKSSRRRIIIILSAFLMLIGGGFLLYFYNLKFYSWINRNVLSNTVQINKWSDKNLKPDLQVNSSLFESKEPDSTNITKGIDSLEQIFHKSRTYEDLITIDRTRSINSLSVLSEKFYGHKDFWVYIYDANKSNIADPENIKSGTMIRIPKIDDRLIDVNNPVSFQFAKRLHDLILKESSQKTDTIKAKKTSNQTENVTETKKEQAIKPASYITSVKFKRGDRLTILSKRYYGHKDFFIYIFEANKDIIKDPNNVPVGIEIKIPQLDPALVDPFNPECIKKARLMYENYLRKSK